MVRIVGTLVVVLLLIGGLVGAFLLLQNRVSFFQRASENDILVINPEVDTKVDGKNFELTVKANASKKIKATKIVVKYDSRYLKLVGEPVINDKLGTLVDFTHNTDQGTFTVKTQAGSKLADSDARLFTFKLRAKTLTPTEGAKVTILLDKSFIKGNGGKNMVTGTSTVRGSTLRVVDSRDDIAPVCEKITVTPATGLVGTNLTVDLLATPSKSKVALAKYIFTFGNNTSKEETSPSTAHTYTTAGSYEITGKAVDTAGKESNVCSTTVEITAPEANPTCSGLSLTPATATVNTSVTASLTGNPPPGKTIAKYIIDFDQGADSLKESTTNSISYTYTAAGTYNVQAIVEDSAGNLSAVPCEKPITITTPPPDSGTDTDSDGVLNPDDNCPSVANPTQADEDGDGTGDACESINDADNVCSAPGDTDCYDCNSDGHITILDYSCFRNSYGESLGE